MRKIRIILKYTAFVFMILLGVLLCYVKWALPNVGKAGNLKVEITPQRIERGKYLSNSVCACTDCHSTRDWFKFAAPVIPNTLGKGGEPFDQAHGFPGIYYAKNITPYALRGWTDGEIIRAIACGVSKDGKALFPEMPYPSYGTLDQEDLYSLVAYLRTMSPVENKVPESRSDFPMNFIINLIPRKAAFKVRPDTTQKVAYGKYVLTAATCTSCHTQENKGKRLAGMELAGGVKFHLPTGGTLYSSNITPDKETGIGTWKEDVFVRRFKAYADSSFTPASLKKGDFNTIMPWMWFSTMTTEDLKAIYAYLRTVKPVKNAVTKFVPTEND